MSMMVDCFLVCKEDITIGGYSYKKDDLYGFRIFDMYDTENQSWYTSYTHYYGGGRLFNENNHFTEDGVFKYFYTEDEAKIMKRKKKIELILEGKESFSLDSENDFEL